MEFLTLKEDEIEVMYEDDTTVWQVTFVLVKEHGVEITEDDTAGASTAPEE